MIKDILHPGNYPNSVNMAILLLRITAGAFMLTHGIGKFSLLFGNEAIQFPDPIGVGAAASLALAVFSEVLCSLFLIFGIATRLSAIPLIITMLVAYLLFMRVTVLGSRSFRCFMRSFILHLQLLVQEKYLLTVGFSIN